MFYRVFLLNNKKIACSSVVVACGTFVNGLIHTGEKTFSAGRFGEKNVQDISFHLKCEKCESTEHPRTWTFRFSNSETRLSKAINSVGQTKVKSKG